MDNFVQLVKEESQEIGEKKAENMKSRVKKEDKGEKGAGKGLIAPAEPEAQACACGGWLFEVK